MSKKEDYRIGKRGSLYFVELNWSGQVDAWYLVSPSGFTTAGAECHAVFNSYQQAESFIDDIIQEIEYFYF